MQDGRNNMTWGQLKQIIESHPLITDNCPIGYFSMTDPDMAEISVWINQHGLMSCTQHPIDLDEDDEEINIVPIMPTRKN